MEHTRARTLTGKDAKRKSVFKDSKASDQRRSVNASSVDSSHDVDVDMKAAATLTRLLRHSRNSIMSLSTVFSEIQHVRRLGRGLVALALSFFPKVLPVRQQPRHPSLRRRSLITVAQ